MSYNQLNRKICFKIYFDRQERRFRFRAFWLALRPGKGCRNSCRFCHGSCKKWLPSATAFYFVWNLFYYWNCIDSFQINKVIAHHYQEVCFPLNFTSRISTVSIPELRIWCAIVLHFYGIDLNLFRYKAKWGELIAFSSSDLLTNAADWAEFFNFFLRIEFRQQAYWHSQWHCPYILKAE